MNPGFLSMSLLPLVLWMEKLWHTSAIRSSGSIFRLLHLEGPQPTLTKCATEKSRQTVMRHLKTAWTLLFFSSTRGVAVMVSIPAQFLYLLLSPHWTPLVTGFKERPGPITSAVSSQRCFCPISYHYLFSELLPMVPVC